MFTSTRILGGLFGLLGLTFCVAILNTPVAVTMDLGRWSRNSNGGDYTVAPEYAWVTALVALAVGLAACASYVAVRHGSGARLPALPEGTVELSPQPKSALRALKGKPSRVLWDYGSAP